MRALAVERSGSVTTIRLTNPPFNWLSPSLIGGVADALLDLEVDASCRAVVLASEGKHFCAGADHGGEMAAPDATERLYEQVVRLFDGSKPIVAAVQGAAVGGGLGLALTADFRVASPGTRFSCSFARLGLHHGFGISLTLPRVVGTQRATSMLYGAEDVKGEEALAVGLCDVLAEDGAVEEAAGELAHRLAANAPLAVQSMRRTMRGNLGADVAVAIARELGEQRRLQRSEDVREGIRAAREKRPPTFVGH